MKYLEDYFAPSDEELKNFSLEQAKALDERNKEIFWRNKTVVQNARAILAEVEPSNRSLRGIEAPVPPYQYVRVLQQMQAKERETETAQAEKAADKAEKPAGKKK
jgi:hypothetical protein